MILYVNAMVNIKNDKKIIKEVSEKIKRKTWKKYNIVVIIIIQTIHLRV